MDDHRTAAAVGRTSEAGLVTVRGSGDLDLGCAPRLRRLLLTAVQEAARGVVADLSAVTFCDSTILTVLVDAHREALAGRVPFAVTADRASVMRPLEILGLDTLLPLYADLDAARAAVSRCPQTRVS
ncbi:STAS domain-containing protein [Amycolatopsis sp. WQ 127309]|uniref:STAS domain-containing protein n=1 Tax=Amycolatopsis sp. WQ 127309 TaxID=2932773 RepID=UPI001FF424A2|nr:STAS domain-containing protein [Amycolatopsis sp. WQ 127309]UOZ05011.1 STAS domain-containing protein [Amycolatopsis sp. WQ 127309]